MVNNILNKCIKKGFFLDKEMLEIFKNIDPEKIDDIINIFSSLDSKEKVITKKYLLKNQEKIEKKLSQKNIKFEDLLEVRYSKNLNVDKKNIKEPLIEQKIYEFNDFYINFKQKYNVLKDRFDLEKYEDITSIRKLPKTGSFSLVASVYDVRNTKNKNILLNVEDLTGNTNIVFSKSNNILYKKVKKVFLDDVVLIRGNILNGLLLANDLVFPKIKTNSNKKTDDDCWVAFIADIHCGSINFLEKNFLKFIKWVNSKDDSQNHKDISKKVKYLFIGGDLIDGVGQYNGQERDLLIKTIGGQYKKIQDLLKLFREDLQIFIIPGNRDSVWKGEPQPKINHDYFEELKERENVVFTGNPSTVVLEKGIKVFSYHGNNMYNLVNEKNEIKNKYKYENPNALIKEFLNMGQISTPYGDIDFMIDKNNSFILDDEIPDIIFTSHFHRSNVDIKDNVLLVNGSCWMKNTKFLDKRGLNPDLCKVPLVNLKTKEVKVLDFNDGEDNYKKGEII